MRADLGRRLRSAAARPWWAVAALAAAVAALFAPAWATGRILAVGDSVWFSIPNYHLPGAPWQPLIFLGMPLQDDPGVQAWYPLTFLSIVPHSFNAFVMLAYVIAAAGAFGYVRKVTGNVGSGFIAGITYAFGGFMISHFGHTGLIHSAAWVGLAIWAIEELRSSDQPRWMMLLAIAECGMFLGGHMWVFVYGSILIAAFALFSLFRARYGRKRFALRTVVALALGVGLASIELLPSLQLSQLGFRQALSFQDFVAWAIPLAQYPVYLLFPYFFGGAATDPYHIHMIGFGSVPVSFTEQAQYAGIVSLVLATIALWRWRADPVVRFWSGVAIVAMVFAVGNDLRVAEVTFRLPVLRLLREPARHAFELTFAVGVLAGIGYDVLARAAAARRALILCAAAVPVLMLLTWAGIALTHPTLLRLAQQAGILLLPIGPVANPAIGIPVLIAAAAFGAVVLFATHPRSALARPLIFIVLAADVLSFAGCAYWRNSVSPSVIAAQADSDALSRATRASGQRIFAIRGGLGTEMQPNLSMMWGIAASGGYDPFVLKRVADLLDITPSGDTPHINADREPDTSLDITSTRYVVLPHTPTDLKAAAPWQIADLALDLSNRRALSLRDRYRFTFARPVPTTRVGLITALENSVDVRDGEHVADVVIDEGNRTITLPLLAGRDSAEIVYDDPSVRGNVKHRRATIFRTFAAERGHSYEAYFRLPARAAVRSVEIRWVDPTPASLKIEQGALIDDRTQQAVPFSALSLLDGRPAAWRDSFANGDFSVAENLHAFPRAWVASAVRALPPDQQLAAIHSGAFADGTPFDARHVALVDDASLQIAAHPHSGGDVAYVSRRDDTSMTVQVGCAARCYVVTSDADYPGWQATVDGVATPVHLTDYALRGAVVPAGDHTLRFFYVPMRLYIGAAITVLSLMALVAVGLFGHRLERSIAKRRTVVSS